MRQPLSATEIQARLVELDGWEYCDGALVKKFLFQHYLDGVTFANEVAALSDAADHHPELTISWRSVRVLFTTHDAGHLVTRRDFVLAKSVDALGYPRPE